MGILPEGYGCDCFDVQEKQTRREEEKRLRCDCFWVQVKQSPREEEKRREESRRDLGK